MNLEILAHLMHGAIALWLLAVGALAVGAARRALAARRRRRTYWADLVRHYRTSSALIARWSDND